MGCPLYGWKSSLFSRVFQNILGTFHGVTFPFQHDLKHVQYIYNQLVCFTCSYIVLPWQYNKQPSTSNQYWPKSIAKSQLFSPSLSCNSCDEDRMGKLDLQIFVLGSRFHHVPGTPCPVPFLAVQPRNKRSRFTL